MPDDREKTAKQIYYTDEALQQKLREEDVVLDNLSLGELLASERTNLANMRNVYALKRTAQASDRTYLAWLRSGFSIVSAGVAFTGLLIRSNATPYSGIIGGITIAIGLLAFVYAWYQYYENYKWMGKTATIEQRDGVPTKSNLVIVTIITFVLLTMSITAFALVLFMR